MTPQERSAIAGLSREDLGQMIRDIPAAIVVVLGLIAFCALCIAVLGEPPK